ncbi:MAG: hypothetical protein ACYC1P_03085, partial [Gaiellaceae bacterium]
RDRLVVAVERDRQLVDRPEAGAWHRAAHASDRASLRDETVSRVSRERAERELVFPKHKRLSGTLR